MTSSRKKDANKSNATKSTGPKTEIGKRTVRLNALAHGFYAHELSVSEADKRDFEILRESLRVQLTPRTALQDIGFEQIVTCCWRCKLAIRLEMHRLKEHFKAHNQSTSNETGPQRDNRETQWYGASPAALRNGIRILQELHNDVSENGLLHQETWKDEIMKAFGVGFYDALTEWKPMDLSAIQLADHLVRHAEIFKHKPPIPLEPAEVQKIVADPKQKHQMVLKLIQLQAQHLLDLQRSNSEAYQMRQMAPSEFAPRYFATASRDLQRAVDWFLYLRSKEL